MAHIILRVCSMTNCCCSLSAGSPFPSFHLCNRPGGAQAAGAGRQGPSGQAAALAGEGTPALIFFFSSCQRAFAGDRPSGTFCSSWTRPHSTCPDISSETSATPLPIWRPHSRESTSCDLSWWSRCSISSALLATSATASGAISSLRLSSGTAALLQPSAA